MGPQPRPAAPHPQPGRRRPGREAKAKAAALCPPRWEQRDPSRHPVAGRQCRQPHPHPPKRGSETVCVIAIPGHPRGQGAQCPCNLRRGHKHWPCFEAGLCPGSLLAALVTSSLLGNYAKPPALLSGVECGRARPPWSALSDSRAVRDLGSAQPPSSTHPRAEGLRQPRVRPSFKSRVHPRVLGPPLRPHRGIPSSSPYLSFIPIGSSLWALWWPTVPRAPASSQLVTGPRIHPHS